MRWEGAEENMVVVDPDCEISGKRWNGKPKSEGFGRGVVTTVFKGSGFFLVKYDSYPALIMHTSEGFRFDRAGKTGAKRVLYAEEHASVGLFG